MAPDSLNEIGKYIRKTRDDVDIALDRYLQHRARIERTRDSFSPELPFVFYFDTNEDETVSMDINFIVPPPTLNSGQGGGGGGTKYTGKCESFTVGSGTQIVSISNPPYAENSVTVYLNGNVLPDSSWAAIDFTSGQIQVNAGNKASNTVVVCYLHIKELFWNISKLWTIVESAATASTGLGSVKDSGLWVVTSDETGAYIGRKFTGDQPSIRKYFPDGSIAWETDVLGDIDGTTTTGPLINFGYGEVSNGSVYVPYNFRISGTGNRIWVVMALDTESGSIEWSQVQPTTEALIPSLALGNDNSVYVLSQEDSSPDVFKISHLDSIGIINTATIDEPDDITRIFSASDHNFFYVVERNNPDNEGLGQIEVWNSSLVPVFTKVAEPPSSFDDQVASRLDGKIVFPTNATEITSVKQEDLNLPANILWSSIIPDAESSGFRLSIGNTAVVSFMGGIPDYLGSTITFFDDLDGAPKGQIIWGEDFGTEENHLGNSVLTVSTYDKYVYVTGYLTNAFDDDLEQTVEGTFDGQPTGIGFNATYLTVFSISSE